MSLDSWLGYYGDSSCGIALQCDKSFKKHLIKYLSCNVSIILDAVIERMENELKGYLEKEIADTKEYLEDLKSH